MVEKLLNIETLWNQLIHPQSISSGAEYVTLWKYFSHPSLVMYYFATPPIKLKLGRQIGGELLIANHLDESLWWANQKHWVPVRSYLLHSFLQVHSAAAPCTSMATYVTMQSQNHFPEPNRNTLDFLHPILLCRITYRAPLEMLFHNNFSPIVREFGCTLPIGGKPLVSGI